VRRTGDYLTVRLHELAVKYGQGEVRGSVRKEHLEQLCSQLEGLVRYILILRGKRSVTERRKIETKLASIRSDENCLLLATGRYVGEGFDDARLDTLLLTLPVTLIAGC
jgi:hypothetical protein